MNKPEYMQFHETCCKRMIEITRKKNADYSGAGEDPFANFRQISGIVKVPNVCEIGFLTRMSDKMSRIGSYIANGKLLCEDESVDDTLLDLANYAILMLGFITEKRHYSQTPTQGEYNGQANRYPEVIGTSERLPSGDEPRYNGTIPKHPADRSDIIGTRGGRHG